MYQSRDLQHSFRCEIKRLKPFWWGGVIKGSVPLFVTGGGGEDPPPGLEVAVGMTHGGLAGSGIGAAGMGAVDSMETGRSGFGLVGPLPPTLSPTHSDSDGNSSIPISLAGAPSQPSSPCSLPSISSSSSHSSSSASSSCGSSSSVSSPPVCVSGSSQKKNQGHP